MPLLGKNALARTGANEFRMAVFNVIPLQQAGGNVEHLLSSAFRRADKIGIGRVGNFLFDR
jgi:hypothetical protein